MLNVLCSQESGKARQRKRESKEDSSRMEGRGKAGREGRKGRGTVKSTLEVEVEHLKFQAYLAYRVSSRLAWVRKSNGA
mgnify:CR=1 FL=1